VVANPRNTFLRELTLEQLRRLWIPEAQGLVRTWQQLDPAWPNEPIRLFGPGRDSGTFDYFTEAVVGKSGTSRTDYVASEDDHVLVQGVLREPGALGYFGFSYYLENQARLRAVAIADTGRPAVAPSRDTILSGAYRPLSRPLFVYVAVRALDREDVRQFVELLVAEGARFAREAKYVPLPANAYPIVQAHLRERRVGTIFNGALAIGITIQELLRREIQR
jgi:phosphate transport system substrate-binding protein